MSPYKHIFFDLDHTLWDMETNSYAALCELAEKHKIRERGIASVDEFIGKYKVINNQLWSDYSKNIVDRETLRSDRFKRAFGLYGIEDEVFTKAFADDYITTAPHKNILLPYAMEILGYLSSKYSLHIITNGFNESQFAKMEGSNITKYFSNVITSEMAGSKKPDPEIFKFALKMAGAKPENSIMIGDNLEADIIGARNSGMAQVFYNPEKVKHSELVTYEISSLKELEGIL